MSNKARPSDQQAAVRADSYGTSDCSDGTSIDALFRNPMRTPTRYYGIQSPETDASLRSVVRGLVEEFAALPPAKLSTVLEQVDKLRVERYGSGLGNVLRTSDMKLRVQFNRALVRRLIGGQEVQVRAHYVLLKRRGRTLTLNDFYDRDQRPYVFRLSGVAGAEADTKRRLDVVGRLVTGVRGDDNLGGDTGVSVYANEIEVDGGRTQFTALVFAEAAPESLAWVLVGTRPTALPGPPPRVSGVSSRLTTTTTTTTPPPNDPAIGDISTIGMSVAGHMMNEDTRMSVRFVALLLFEDNDRRRVLMVADRNEGLRLPGGRVMQGQRPWWALQYHYRKSVGDVMPTISSLYPEMVGIQTIDIWEGRMRVYIGQMESNVPVAQIDGATWQPWKDGYGSGDVDKLIDSGMLEPLTPATDALLDEVVEAGALRRPSPGPLPPL